MDRRPALSRRLLHLPDLRARQNPRKARRRPLPGQAETARRALRRDRRRPIAAKHLRAGHLRGRQHSLRSELAHPDRLVAVDRRAPSSSALSDYLAQDGRSDTISTHYDVDQADRERLRSIADETFGQEPLDLVFDDCSHLYEPTRASFNELFPRLRPGGLYVIEDWRWAHAPLDDPNPEGMWPEETPLTRLIFEIALTIPSVPGLVASLNLEFRTVEVTRGERRIDPSDLRRLGVRQLERRASVHRHELSSKDASSQSQAPPAASGRPSAAPSPRPAPPSPPPTSTRQSSTTSPRSSASPTSAGTATPSNLLSADGATEWAQALTERFGKVDGARPPRRRLEGRRAPRHRIPRRLRVAPRPPRPHRPARHARLPRRDRP